MTRNHGLCCLQSIAGSPLRPYESIRVPCRCQILQPGRYRPVAAGWVRLSARFSEICHCFLFLRGGLCQRGPLRVTAVAESNILQLSPEDHHCWKRLNVAGITAEFGYGILALRKQGEEEGIGRRKMRHSSEIMQSYCPSTLSEDDCSGGSHSAIGPLPLEENDTAPEPIGRCSVPVTGT